MPALPRFHVKSIETNPLRLVGTLSTTTYGARPWVKSGWVGDLRVGSSFVTGRWTKVGTSWSFALDDESALETIGSARKFDVFDGYWGKRAALVLDESLCWNESTWGSPTDRDHCRICRADIDSQTNARHLAASDSHRICPACHSRYVQVKNINFTDLGGPAG